MIHRLSQLLFNVEISLWMLIGKSFSFFCRFASYRRVTECITMEKACDGQVLDSTDVFEVIGEPAIVINGVPNVMPVSTAAILDTTSNPVADDDPCFGDLVVGRKIQKLLGDQYYFGKVEKFDTETNCYRVVYDDGDSEDMEWHKLEDLLVPLDTSIPLTILALHICKLEPESHIKLAKGRKNPRNSFGSEGKKPKLLQIAQGGESKDEIPMEANFSCRTPEKVSETRDGPETENPETCLSMYEHDESLSKLGVCSSSKTCNRQESDSTPVSEVIGEPAVLINGLPGTTPGYTTTIQDTVENPEPETGPCCGELFEGRNIRKLFGDRYYLGKVEKYDKETKWYRVVYEDGDFEDLDWHELEEVLLPLDISIPLPTIASHGRKSEKSVCMPLINLGKDRENHKLAKGRKNHSFGSKGKTPELLQITQVSERREAKLKETNFSEKTLQETLQMQNGLLRENEETYFSMCNHYESLFKLRDSVTASNACDEKESATTPVFKVIGEPAIVINGVPDATPGYTTTIHGIVNNPEPGDGACFGEWLEGRKVRKVFGDQYYSGKVENYNKKTKHYRVVYEDGNFEYLASSDLENLLVPLDISIPVTTLASHLCMSANSVLKPRKERTNHANTSTSTNKTAELCNISQAWETGNGKLVEADVDKRTHRGNSQMQDGLQIDSAEPCLQITKQLESVSRPGEGSVVSENNQNGESVDKMLKINVDGLVLADAHREASGQESSADVRKITYQGNSQMQEGLQIGGAQPCLQITEQVESVSRPGEGSVVSENNQNGEIVGKTLNMLQAPDTTDMNGDGLALADADRAAYGQECLRRQRDFQKQSGKTARAEKQRRREGSVVSQFYHPK